MGDKREANVRDRAERSEQKVDPTRGERERPSEFAAPNEVHLAQRALKTTHGPTAREFAALQHHAGNKAVSRLVAQSPGYEQPLQRAGAAVLTPPAPPVAAPGAATPAPVAAPPPVAAHGAAAPGAAPPAPSTEPTAAEAAQNDTLSSAANMASNATGINTGVASSIGGVGAGALGLATGLRTNARNLRALDAADTEHAAAKAANKSVRRRAADRGRRSARADVGVNAAATVNNVAGTAAAGIGTAGAAGAASVTTAVAGVASGAAGFVAAPVNLIAGLRGIHQTRKAYQRMSGSAAVMADMKKDAVAQADGVVAAAEAEVTRLGSELSHLRRVGGRVPSAALAAQGIGEGVAANPHSDAAFELERQIQEAKEKVRQAKEARAKVDAEANLEPPQHVAQAAQAVGAAPPKPTIQDIVRYVHGQASTATKRRGLGAAGAMLGVGGGLALGFAGLGAAGIMGSIGAAAGPIGFALAGLGSLIGIGIAVKKAYDNHQKKSAANQAVDGVGAKRAHMAKHLVGYAAHGTPSEQRYAFNLIASMNIVDPNTKQPFTAADLHDPDEEKRLEEFVKDKMKST